MLNYQLISILPNISDFSGAVKRDNQYALVEGHPAFFSFSYSYAKLHGFIIRLSNSSKESCVLSLLFSCPTRKNSFLKNIIFPASAKKDIYIPAVPNCLILEAFCRAGNVVIENLSLINYKPPKSSRLYNSVINLGVSSNPPGAIKFDREGIYITAGPASPITGVITPRVSFAKTDVIELAINSPLGIKLLNQFGLYDIWQGQIVGWLNNVDFSPQFLSFETNPDNLVRTSTQLKFIVHSYYLTKLEEYLNG